MLHAEYVQGSGCVIISTNNTILAAIFIYSMCFDLLVIVLNMYKLLGIGIGPPRVFGKSRLSKLIFADGLIYFLIACVIFVFRNLKLLNVATASSSIWLPQYSFCWNWTPSWVSFSTFQLLFSLLYVNCMIKNVQRWISTQIVACRVVRRLTKFTNQGAEL